VILPNLIVSTIWLRLCCLLPVGFNLRIILFDLIIQHNSLSMLWVMLGTSDSVVSPFWRLVLQLDNLHLKADVACMLV
jgi:hypothetical protein